MMDLHLSKGVIGAPMNQKIKTASALQQDAERLLLSANKEVH